MNLPDDYNMHWRQCTKCGRKFHASDGACDICLNREAKKYSGINPLPHGFVHVYVNEKGEVTLDPVRPNAHYLILNSGKWIIALDDDKRRVVCARRHWPESFLQENDVLVEVPECKKP